MQKQKNKQRGITLIVLVVTIIVLIILAGVSINMIVGENGIITQAQRAKEDTEIKRDEEKISLAIVESQIALHGTYDEIDEKELKKQLEIQFGYNAFSIVRNNDMSYTIKLLENQKEYDILTNGEIHQLDRIMHPTSVYAIIYSDGTLAFNTTGNVNQDKMNQGITVLYNTKNMENIGDISKTIFENENAIPWINYVEGIKYIDIEEPVAPYTTDFWFANCVNVKEINLDNLYTNNSSSMKGMFYKCINLEKIDLKHLNTDNVTDMYAMFLNCESLKEVDLSRINTENVLDFEWMFGRCYNLEQLNLFNFDTSKAEKTTAMFYDSKKLSEILVSDKWQINTETSTSMFTNCKTDHVTYI